MKKIFFISIFCLSNIFAGRLEVIEVKIDKGIEEKQEPLKTIKDSNITKGISKKVGELKEKINKK